MTEYVTKQVPVSVPEQVPVTVMTTQQRQVPRQVGRNAPADAASTTAPPRRRPRSKCIVRLPFPQSYRTPAVQPRKRMSGGQLSPTRRSGWINSPGDRVIVASRRRKMDSGRGIMGPPIGQMIRHIRYEEFVALKSEGAGDFDGFLAAVETLVEQMEDVAAHHVLVNLRRASIPPLPEALLARARSTCAAGPGGEEQGRGRHRPRRRGARTGPTPPRRSRRSCGCRSAASATTAPRSTGSARWSGAGPASRPSET